ncbi:unnamed protein product [Fraxinus pennsylvanica]|uniref:RNase H type-1 domain-containing protein n=1 Tax=Fraxinus pennsylvanica TaxID=56036 RepID=A0AAD1ZYS1_9LAMI|nr:unnamed protein product [Fraxinus pennsylvanica]
MVEWAKWVWHNALPKRSSVVIWKALSGSLSFDDRIRQVGVAMASRCNCCTTGHEEDSNHVLSTGDFADEVWRRLSLALGVSWRTRQSWWDRIKIWWARAKRSSQLGCLQGFIPCLVTWRLWIRRYKARMEGLYESVEDVVLSIRFWLRHLTTNVKKTRVLTREEETFLIDMGIPCVVRKLSPIHLVTWKKPMVGRAKLNVDGSSLGNSGQAGGGGVIRNDKGMVLAAFATNFGIASNNEAELRALLEGLKLCQHIGVFHVDVECDSKIVVEWMLKRKCTVWYLWDFWEELLNLMNLFEIQVSHQFREENQVANLLAKMDAHGVTQRSTPGTELPMYARGLTRLDRIGVPYIRK